MGNAIWENTAAFGHCNIMCVALYSTCINGTGSTFSACVNVCVCIIVDGRALQLFMWTRHWFRVCLANGLTAGLSADAAICRNRIVVFFSSLTSFIKMNTTSLAYHSARESMSIHEAKRQWMVIRFYCRQSCGMIAHFALHTSSIQLCNGGS